MRNWINRVTSGLVILLLAVSGETVAAPSVLGIDLVSEKRISRTVFEYTYRVNVLGDTVDYEQVSATLTAVGVGTTIVSPTAKLGTVVALAPKASSTSVVIRHDRTLPFDSNALQWSVAGQMHLELGALLGGDANSPAYQFTIDFDAHATFPESEYEVVSDTRVLRTSIGIGYNENATVGDINELLKTIGGRIVYSLKNSAMLYIRIPDPGNFEALKSIVSSINGMSSVDFAQFMIAPKPDVVLANVAPYVFGSNELNYSTLIGIRAHIAWNARKALSVGGLHNLNLVVQDYFGAGVPAGNLFPSFQFPIKKEELIDCGFGFVGDPSSHGYGILGIIGASHLDAVTATGVFPSPPAVVPPFSYPLIPVEVIDLKNFCVADTYWLARLAKTVREMTAKGKRIVVNTSLGIGRAEAVDPNFVSKQADEWIRYLGPAGPAGELVRKITEQQFFHSSSAGNVEWSVETIPNARDNGGIQRAALDNRLNNTAVVENRSISNISTFGKSSCLNGGSLPLSQEGGNHASYKNGNISAIGSTVSGETKGLVWYTGPMGTTALLDNGGTSSAAPQVAGLALYLWGLRPDLKSDELWKVIRNNTATVPSCNNVGQPLADAYATVLTADNVSNLPSSAPVRRAILDVNEDGHFNMADIEMYLSILKNSPEYNYLSTNTSWLPFSRADLNGDGWISSTKTARFNLDMDYDANFASRYETAKQMMEDIDIGFNENAVSDLQALCYYAYSPLYSGDQADRTAALGALCAPVNDFCITPLPAKYISTGTISSQTDCNNGEKFSSKDQEYGYWYFTGNNVNGRNLLAEGKCAEDTAAQTLYGQFDSNYHQDGALGQIVFNVPSWGLTAEVVRTAPDRIRRTHTQQYSYTDDQGANVTCTSTSTYTGDLKPITPPP